MQIKQISLILLCVLYNASIKAQNQYNFINLDFDEAKVYLYDGFMGQLIVNKGILDSTIVNPEGYKLSQTELSELDNLLNIRVRKRKTTYQECTGSHCFEPHHGIVFYKNQKIVGHISLCFECNNLETDLGKTESCPFKLMSLFESFIIQVEGQLYQSLDSKLNAVIQQVNIKRYGVDYIQKRMKEIEP